MSWSRSWGGLDRPPARPYIRYGKVPRLVLLVAGYGATVLSAAFGVHPGHSLWSDYERMQGVVDQAHWVALAVVLASVLHTPRGWRAVLQANLAAGAAMACIVLARALDIGVPYFGACREASPLGRRRASFASRSHSSPSRRRRNQTATKGAGWPWA